MAETKEKRYVSDNAQLMAEWDFDKNSLLGYEPQTITYGSAIKVWWICQQGHKWEASPNHRSRGRGCPECAKIQSFITKRRNIVARRGSLSSNNPDLALQWHPTKNAPLTPNDISVNSAERVWWLCKKGHEWDAPINSRNSGVGCPVCSGHKIVVGVNDLATVRPDLALQWHPTKNGELKPSAVTVGNDKKVWWKCEKGHQWQSQINNRTSGCGCPFCSGKKVLVGYNDISTIMPQLVAEWHPSKNGDLIPQNFTVGSNKKVWWMCKKGHEWQAAISHRTKGRRCPVCFGESRTSFPEQAIYYYLRQVTTALNRYKLNSRTEIDIYLPDYKIGVEYDGLFFHSSEKSAEREKRKQDKLDNCGITLFRVKESNIFCNGMVRGRVVYAKPGANDIELGLVMESLLACISTETPYSFDISIDIARDRNQIYEQYVQGEKEKSLAVVNPKLASEWHPTNNGNLLPDYVSVFSNKKVWWLCDEGHEWQAVINSRRNGAGCPFCSGQRAIVGINDLATVNPDLASQWHPSKNGQLSPQNVKASSNRFVWWLCEEGHEWKAMIYDRSNGCGCPICSGHKVLVGYNDLATTMPALAKEWHPTKNGTLTSRDITSGSSKRVWWICSEGHEWQAVISSRKSGYGCPYCAGQKAITGYNDLATVNPILASEWHPNKNGAISPSNISAGTNKKVWWLGKCGHEWEASIGSRNAGNGCPYCASQKILVGFNDLETLNPSLAREWHSTYNGAVTPRDVMPGSNRKVWWQCRNGHEWQNSVNTRNRGNGCPYCANQLVLMGYNDLQTLNPELARQWHPTKNGELTPRDVMPGSNKKAWWICEKGHEWEAVISSRNKGAGCMLCYRQSRKKH
ncbi:MAG: hypothetical protein IJE25_08670 [Clostridia bacterium]|nr:hypothetical protein [Clostridia bacterium]